MDELRSELIDVDRLQPGMYVELDLGWMAHPFPTGSFKITSERQIDIIRGLGRRQVRFVPGKSDPPAAFAAHTGPDAADDDTGAVLAKPQTDEDAAREQQRRQRAEQLATQHRALALCERRFGQTVRLYKQAIEQVYSQPQAVLAQCQTLINDYVTEMLDAGESAIRLLSEGSGDRMALHPVNITILSLLLGKQLGLCQTDMTNLGLAAFMHDIGKLELPDRVRWLEDSFSAHEVKAYQTHVAQGVKLGQRLALPADALLAIAQHHEMVDGSGFPAHLKDDAITLPARILALVNRYENLCNPSRPSNAITPHDALALLFAQFKSRFDAKVLGSFVRMMGVYPPGSVVQLTDARFGLVVSVNSSRPLKPSVVVFDAQVPKHEALILNLEGTPDLGIQRCLKPTTLPRAALDYLSPRQRICYFFERAVEQPVPEASS